MPPQQRLLVEGRLVQRALCKWRAWRQRLGFWGLQRMQGQPHSPRQRLAVCLKQPHKGAERSRHPIDAACYAVSLCM